MQSATHSRLSLDLYTALYVAYSFMQQRGAREVQGEGLIVLRGNIILPYQKDYRFKEIKFALQYFKQKV